MPPRRRGLVPLLMVALLMAHGCSDGQGGSNGVTVSGTVTETVPGALTRGDPISDVTVCVFSSNLCGTTDENGFYSFRVVRNQDTLFSFLREGYGPVLVGTRATSLDFTVDAGLATTETLETFFDELDGVFPPQVSGYVTATTFRGDEPLPGISYRLVGSSANSFYFEDDLTPNTTLLETQSPGGGGFFNVSALTVELVVQGAANCIAVNSFAGDASDSFRLPIRTGFWTQTEIDCE